MVTGCLRILYCGVLFLGTLLCGVEFVDGSGGSVSGDEVNGGEQVPGLVERVGAGDGVHLVIWNQK